MKPPEVSWQTLDWAALDRLRDLFLAGKASTKPYWTSLSDLANYDFTFGERIGWKWDAMLGELRQLGWTPPANDVLDWACGSGIAGRRVIEWFGPANFRRLRVFDRSALAMEFAVAKARDEFPSLTVETANDLAEVERQPPARGQGGVAALADTAGPEAGAPSIGLLVISHVLGELTESGGRALRHAIDRAAAVLWVEPGTFADSRALIAVREGLRNNFVVVAPCTHQAGCGLLAPGNQRHWCHHFAPPPPNLMADSSWVRFAQRAGIDLRSLPFSFLALERRGLRDPVPGVLPAGCSRVIGTPRFYKGYANIFSCQQDGVYDVKLERKVAPLVFKQVEKSVGPRVHTWKVAARRVTEAGASVRPAPER
jgi:hypothetical protein